MQEKDDHNEHNDLADDRILRHFLQRLIGHADADGRADRAHDVADAADHDSHEAIDDVVLAHGRADVADLRKERTGESGETAAKREREHVDALRANADARGHLAVLHDRANEQAERRFGEQQPRQQDDDGCETDDEDPVVAEHDVGDGDIADQPRGRIHIDVGRAEKETEELLEHERNAPCREQRFKRAIVEETDDAALQHEADQRGREERDGNGEDEIPILPARPEAAHEDALGHVRRVGADRDQFAVGHVDDAHQAEGDGEAERGDEQDGTEADAAKNGAEEIDPEEIIVEGEHGLLRGVVDSGIGGVLR